ncbi:MAG: transposase domain-containing protein [Lachnospiraceae bacterium]|nr:transposase domain-containing protein [Lachnospiraceae bacterium]
MRPFAVGRKVWKLIDTVSGAKASAVIYSIVETAKANDLRVYDYLEHLLTVIPEHMDDTNLDFCEDLMPWSDRLPEKCRRKKGSPRNIGDESLRAQ